jgi:hypothetical protein
MKKLIFRLSGYISLIIILITPCFGEECLVDINCDGVVDGSDLVEFAKDYGKTNCPECIPAPVPSTGQQTSYAVRDDGDLQMGVSWPTSRLTDNEDGTVIDNLTGQIWMINANCFGTKDWLNALNSCNSLANGTCGLSDGSQAGDWWLPNVRELHSLFDYSQVDPPLPDDYPFTNVQLGSYWSSTTLADSSIHAWFVNTHDGYLQNDTKGNNKYVWCVRSRQ